MKDSQAAILFYCEIHRGFGHWMRSLSICRALARRFSVVLAVTSDMENLDVPPEIEMVRFPANAHYPCNAFAPDEGRIPLGGHLMALFKRVQPAAVILEYFPFGRQQSALFLIPFLRAARNAPICPVILTSLRDIQEQTLEDQLRYDKRVVQIVNRFVDGVMVHSDPDFIVLADTFALAGELTAPIYYTGYVAPEAASVSEAVARERSILVSVGGGCGELDLLRTAIEAQRLAAHSWDFRMRVIAGKFLAEEDWQALCATAQGVPGLELVRWVPDLNRELARVSVSVSRCGYNTVLNLIGSRTPALVIPFVKLEEDEQTYRAAKLEKLDVLHVLPQDRLNPETLVGEIRKIAEWQPRRLVLDCGGAEQTARLVDELITWRAVSRVGAIGAD